MNKSILRSIKRSSAKQKPEIEQSYFQSVIDSKGVYLLLLEPVTMGEDITDFRILIASNSIKTLEDDHDLEGKLVSQVFLSAEQWLAKCRSAMVSTEAVTHNVTYLSDHGTSLFKVFLSRNGNLLIANWYPINKGMEKKVESVIAEDPVIEKDMVATQTIRTIIHEIRNPLTAIALANQLLMDYSNSNTNNNGVGQSQLTLHSLTSIIFENSRKIEDHLRQLLLPKNDEAMAQAPLDICNVMCEALQKVESRLFLGRVKVCRNFQPGYLVKGHEGTLITALLNLIINAVEAMSQSNAHLWISIYPVDKHIKLVIRDNGVGIEPELLSRIFEPNFSNKQNGLGLGLANVKEILDNHNASISVSSELGKGTSFSILFPHVNMPEKTNKNSSQFRMDF